MSYDDQAGDSWNLDPPGDPGYLTYRGGADASRQDSSDQPPEFDSDFIDARRRGVSWLAWIVILATTIFFASLAYLRQPADADGDGGTVNSLQTELAGKYSVAAAEMGTDKRQIYKSAHSLNTGPLKNRFCFVTLAGDLVGPKEALAQLDELDEKLAQHDRQLNQREAQVKTILRSLYSADEEHPAVVSESDQKLLRDELGWFGQLALAPKSEDGASSKAREEVLAPARRKFYGLILFGMSLVMLGFAGFGGAITFGILVGYRKLPARVEAGSIFGGIYAETFAVWMLLFLALNLSAAFVPPQVGGLLTGGLVLLASLGALAWPLLRGVRWSELCHEIGWTKGRPIMEPIWGVVCYVSTLPLLLGGFAMMWVLGVITRALGPAAGEFAAPNAPSHPLVESVNAGNWVFWAQAIFVACVAAPIAEETMFRGVLYRHLRDATVKWRVFVSVLFSAVVNSVIFAAVHPQGLIAIPVLASLAIGFSLAREWRGSLIAPMTMHALNNAGAMAMLFLLTL